MAPDPKIIAAKLATIDEALQFLTEMSALTYEAFVSERRDYPAAEGTFSSPAKPSSRSALIA